MCKLSPLILSCQLFAIRLYNHVTVPYFSVWLKRLITTILFCCCCFLVVREVTGDYPQGYCSQCPQDREYDMVAILKDQESLVMSHLLSAICHLVNIQKLLRVSEVFVWNLVEIMSDRSQRRSNEAIFASSHTGHAYFQSILIECILKGK